LTQSIPVMPSKTSPISALSNSGSLLIVTSILSFLLRTVSASSLISKVTSYMSTYHKNEFPTQTILTNSFVPTVFPNPVWLEVYLKYKKE